MVSRKNPRSKWASVLPLLLCAALLLSSCASAPQQEPQPTASQEASAGAPEPEATPQTPQTPDAANAPEEPDAQEAGPAEAEERTTEVAETEEPATEPSEIEIPAAPQDEHTDASSSASFADAETASGWQQVYTGLLTAHAGTLSTVDDFQTIYGLYDFTQDGVPELFLQKMDGPYGTYDVYTVENDAAVLLGQAPGYPFSIFPLQDANSFLSVMRRMFCESVWLYTLENGSLQKTVLLDEVPVENLPKDASTPLDMLGYHDFTDLQTYAVDDLSGFSQPQTDVGANQELFSLIAASAG